MNFSKKEALILVGIIAFFLVLRLPALHQPYHQDEYKWAAYASLGADSGVVPHPPLTEFIYIKFLGPLVGDNNFRFIPLGFSFVNLLLVFYLAKLIGDKKSAFWTVFLFVISFYSILSSTMVDVDGAVMPFFFLIMMVGYVKLRALSFELRGNNWVWGGVMLLGAIGGFMIKVSAILPIFALFIDFLIEKGVFSDKKKILKYLGFGVLGLGALGLLLLISKFVFPFFNLGYSFKYWKHFANSSGFLDRGWLQTFIQFAKAILYASPLLLLPVFFIDREIWQKTRPFFLFIFIGLFFYLFAFDFSLGALDRYFQFLVVPLCLISGAIFAKYVNYVKKKEAIVFVIVSALIFKLQFLNHFVPALYPKTEWIGRILSLKWNFLYPFSGGSGPLPFYISFIFMALVWICCFLLVIISLGKKEFKRVALVGILILGFLYNGVFIEEYLLGKINGSAKNLVFDSVSFIAKDTNIKKVAVYNDNGGYNVKEIGKYQRRIYATPQFEATYREFFRNFQGHILFIDIPRVDENSMYIKYFNSCKIVYRKQDISIESIIYDCTK